MICKILIALNCLGLKTYSNWPTYPQLYSNGELLGGLDIVKELVENGELKSQFPTEISLDDRQVIEFICYLQECQPCCVIRLI